MLSTFHGIEVGKTGILSHKQGLNVVGHNLANSANNTYSRQRVQMGTMPPLYAPGLNRAETAGQIGEGTLVEKIARVRDMFLEDRILFESGILGYWKQKDFFLHQMEVVFGEPATSSMSGIATLKGRYEEFLETWNNLANYPTEAGHREQLRDIAKGLVSNINTLYDQLHTLQQNADSMVISRVDEINGISKAIAELNVEISKVEAMGDNPNDLYDRRDALIEKLSKITDINVSRLSDKEFIVYIGGQKLVQGEKYEQLKAVPDKFNDGFAKVVWEDDNTLVQIRNGELKGLMEIRDIDIADQITKLDNFAINMTETVNEIHVDSFSLNNHTGVKFFHNQYITRSANGDFDSNKDGIVDSTGIYKVAGTQELDKEAVIGINGTINLGPAKFNGQDVIVNYRTTDKVKDVVNKINNSQADVVAYINHNSNLVIKAVEASDKNFTDFTIRHIEDSGNFLTGYAGVLKQSGPQGSYDWNRIGEMSKLASHGKSISLVPDKHPSRWIALDQAILQDSRNIAAARGIDTNGDGSPNKMTGVGDGSAALNIVAALASETEANQIDALTKIDHEAVMVGKDSKGFGSYLNKIIADLGSQTQSAKLQLQEEEAKMHHLQNTRESISGVNIDEEVANLIKFQHGYTASAKFISVMDKMLETIMRM